MRHVIDPEQHDLVHAGPHRLGDESHLVRDRANNGDHRNVERISPVSDQERAQSASERIDYFGDHQNGRVSGDGGSNRASIRQTCDGRDPPEWAKQRLLSLEPCQATDDVR
jgi:hypothetical protein